MILIIDNKAHKIEYKDIKQFTSFILDNSKYNAPNSTDIHLILDKEEENYLSIDIESKYGVLYTPLPEVKEKSALDYSYMGPNGRNIHLSIIN
jgi:hypothetical protein